MLKDIFKQFGILLLVTLLIGVLGIIGLNFDDSCGYYWGCIPFSFVLACLLIILLWIVGIPVIISRLTKKYANRNIASPPNGVASKPQSTFGIELVYWIFGVMLPGMIVVINLFTGDDYLMSGYDRLILISILLLVFIPVSISFWRRIHPPKYRTILFIYISIILFIFAAILGMG